MDAAILCSTCCMLPTVPDIAEYHCVGAAVALMSRAPAPMSRLPTDRM